MFRIVFLLLFFASSLHCTSFAKKGDFQLWTNENTKIPFTAETEFLVNAQQRFGDNARQLYYYHYEGFFRAEMYYGSKIGLGVRETIKKSSTNTPFSRSNVILIDFLLSSKLLNHYNYFSRGRAQYNIQKGKNVFVYRALSGIQAPPIFNCIFLKISNETFWSPRKKFNEDRMMIGFEAVPMKFAALEVDYMLRGLNPNRTRFYFQNAVNVKFSVKF